MSTECLVHGCVRAISATGLCHMHYKRLKRNGTTGGPEPHSPGRKRQDARQRFWRKVDKSGPLVVGHPSLGPCWIWTSTTDGHGYGSFTVDGKRCGAHTLAWIWEVGPIPEGHVLDHFACYRHDCVNPGHLTPVTHQQNMENRSELDARNKSGHRGVMWDKHRRKWRVHCRSNGRSHYGGYFDELDNAASAARDLRLRLMSNNVQDRLELGK